MVQKITTVMVCDNPECEAEQEILSRRTEQTPGVHLKVKVVDGENNSPWRELYACSTGCVCPAIEAA